MDSGSGKNRDSNQTKEPPGDVPRPREESSTATAAAAAAEPPPPAPPSERLQERINGSPEAGGCRNPSAAAAVAAEAAAAAQRKGAGIAAPSRRGSAGGKPPFCPCAASVSRAREPKPAGGKPPLPLPRLAVPVPASRSKSKGKKPMSRSEVVQRGMVARAKWKEMSEGRMEMEEAFNELLEESKKAMPEQGTATQQKEQLVQHKNKTIREMDRKAKPEGTVKQRKGKVKLATIWPKTYYKGSLWRKCRMLWQRNMLIIIVVVLAIGYLPARAEAFQQFDTVKDTANGLALLNNLNDVRLQLREEASTAGFSLGLWFALFILGVFLMGGLALRFVDPGQEPALPVEGEPNSLR